jgi:hypothetical protein
MLIGYAGVCKNEQYLDLLRDALIKAGCREQNILFERNLIRERTLAGLEAARARGRLGERPEVKASSSKVAMAKKLYADKTNEISDICCKTLHISRATLYRSIHIKCLVPFPFWCIEQKEPN